MSESSLLARERGEGRTVREREKKKEGGREREESGGQWGTETVREGKREREREGGLLI
jgi:hypothetical protein